MQVLHAELAHHHQAVEVHRPLPTSPAAPAPSPRAHSQNPCLRQHRRLAFAPYHDRVLAEWSSLSHGHRMVWLRATHSWPSNEAADELWRHASAFEREKWVNTTITSRAMHTLRATLAARGQQSLAHHTRRHLSALGVHDAEGAAAVHRRLHDSQGLTEEARRAMTEARQHVDPRLVRIMDEHHRSAGRGASNEQVLETVLGREQHGLAVAMQALANVRSHEVLDHIEQYTLVSIPPTQPRAPCFIMCVTCILVASSPPLQSLC